MNISLNIDKSGEKQNVVIDTDSTEYLLEQIDWLPMADLRQMRQEMVNISQVI